MALELRDVAKSFGPVVALRSGSLAVAPGSIHALVGENGAGKSTLVKIVAGVHRRDSGVFRLHGEDVDFGSTAESKAAGIAVIYQEPTLFPDLSVTENIFMGRQPRGRGRAHRPGRDVRRGRRPLRAARCRDRPAPPGPRPLDRRPADHRDRQGHLARRQRAGHGRADRRAERRRGRPAVRRRPQPARRGSRAGLHLAPLRRGLRPLRHGHRDARRRLRLDRRRSPRPRSSRSSPAWSAARSATCSPRPPAEIGESVLAGRRACPRSASSTTSAFTVRAGEIVGLAGLVGAGRSEIARAVFGVDTYDSGSVHLDGKAGRRRDPAGRDPRRHGVHPRGPPQAGPGHRRLGRAQRRRRHPPRAVAKAGLLTTATRTGPPAPGPAGSRSRPARST